MGCIFALRSLSCTMAERMLGRALVSPRVCSALASLTNVVAPVVARATMPFPMPLPLHGSPWGVAGREPLSSSASASTSESLSGPSMSVRPRGGTGTSVGARFSSPASLQYLLVLEGSGEGRASVSIGVALGLQGRNSVARRPCRCRKDPPARAMCSSTVPPATTRTTVRGRWGRAALISRILKQSRTRPAALRSLIHASLRTSTASALCGGRQGGSRTQLEARSRPPVRELNSRTAACAATQSKASPAAERSPHTESEEHRGSSSGTRAARWLTE
mmetsp:Transcript_12326/g.27629  ORF Transcript_12326/g.27629 Transcript_12326/m.27629 type:complete len:276 (-) Transcript_12326:770-1597(-)